MDRKRLVYTILLSLALFSLLPVSIWLENSYDWPWLFLGVFGLTLVGYALLWRYRLVFLGLLVLLATTGILYSHGDIVASFLFFIAPYVAACVAIAYRIAERLPSLEWVEPEYPEEEGVGVLEELVAQGPSSSSSRGRQGRQSGEEERGDPCGDDIIDLLLERGAEDPEVERRLREYMECRARYFIEHFDEFEKRSSIRVERK